MLTLQQKKTFFFTVVEYCGQHIQLNKDWTSFEKMETIQLPCWWKISVGEVQNFKKSDDHDIIH